IEEINHALRMKKDEEMDRQSKIYSYVKMIEDWKNELASVEVSEDLQPQTDAINNELKKLQEERATIDSDISDVTAEKMNQEREKRRLADRLGQLSNKMSMKEEHLKSRFQDTHSALMWLRKNKDKFKKRVYEPLMLEINMKDNKHSKYVENHISVNDMRSFLFENKEDMELFLMEMCDRQQLRVNAVCAPAESCAESLPTRPIEELRKYGFFSYLRELFDVPRPVMSYLCSQYHVHDVPVGTESTKGMIGRVIQETKLKQIYTAEEKYIIKMSAYTKLSMSTNTSLRPAEFLSNSVDVDERRHLENQQQEISNKLKSLDMHLTILLEKQRHLERRDNELRQKKKELLERGNRRRQLESKIEVKYNILRQLEKDAINPEDECQKANVKIKELNIQKARLVTELTHFIKKCITLNLLKADLVLESITVAAEKSKLESECKAASVQLRAAEQEFHRLDDRKRILTDNCKELLKRARQICKLSPDQHLPKEFQTAFQALPNTLEEIDAFLNEEKTRASCFTGLSASVVEEYNKQTQEIQQLTEYLDEKKNELANYKQNISQVKEMWLNPLKNLVEQINEKFSRFFSSIHCVGEVDLHVEKEEEYDKYGIRIRVKFHSTTELHELTPYHQSGG
ncbi:SMC5 protein, partial [Heliornis fulica]|nr:SMC5 protein [Heliornis fulica]